MGKKIEVLVADDHPAICAGVCSILTSAEDVTVTGEARDGREAVELAQRLRPDVILMDLMMPRLNGVEAVHEILAEQPDQRIVILTGSETADPVFAAIRAGAVGYLTKLAGLGEILGAVRRVHRGELVLDPAVTRQLLASSTKPLAEFSTSAVDRAGISGSMPQIALTERQIEILRGLAKGLDSQQIANRYGVTESTIRSHISNVLTSLGFAGRSDLLHALRRAARGEASPLPRNIVEQVIPRTISKLPSTTSHKALTDREIEVATWLARGFSNRRIGDQLHISEATVRAHVSHILQKLELDNRVEVALHALRQGWAELAA